MSPAFVVPDTNVLLALGFGDRHDSQAPRAAAAMGLAVSSGARLLCPPSIDAELQRKLGDLDLVYTELQRIIRNLPEPEPPGDRLAHAERVLRTLRANAGSRITRYADAIEVFASQVIMASPGLPLGPVLARTAGEALLLKEAIRFRSKPAYLEMLDHPAADNSPLEPRIQYVKGSDLAHVRSCQLLGEEFAARVIFVVLERPILTQKEEIERRFDRVVVTSPPFIGAYLNPP